MEKSSQQNNDLHTQGVEFMQCKDAKGLLEGIFGKQIHQYMLYELTRAYVPFSQRNLSDNNRISWIGNLEDGIDRGGIPYYCPTGYMKVPIKLQNAENPTEFDLKTKGWSICYHGTKESSVLPILKQGLKGSFGSWIKENEKAVYLSPSIEYCSHPRYARWFLHEGCFYQVLFQCRTQEKSNITNKSETLIEKQQSVQIDPHYQNNNDFEWITQVDQNHEYADSSQLVITGLLIRKSLNPYHMKQFQWWIMPHLTHWHSPPSFLDIGFETCWHLIRTFNGKLQFAQRNEQQCGCFCCENEIGVPETSV